MEGSLLIEALRREHLRMREVLALIAAELDRHEQDGTADFLLVAKALSYMQAFPSRVHHPKEDVIFERLAIRDPAYRLRVEELREQHLQIYEVEIWLKAMALRCPAPGTTETRRFISFGHEYLKLQYDHIRVEDHVLFPRALEVLQLGDWAQVAVQVQDMEDPLSGTAPAEEFRVLYESLQQAHA